MAVMVCGAAVLVEAVPAALVSALGPVFPALQLAGAWALTQGRAPAWLAPAALGIAALRLADFALGWEWVEPAVGIGLEPVAGLAGAGMLAAWTRRQGASPALVASCAVMVAAALADGLSARHWATGVPGWLTLYWILLTASGFPLQHHVATSKRIRDHRLRRIESEAELEENRARFRALSEGAFDLVAELDEDERFRYVNPRYTEVLGHPREKLLGSRPADFVHPEDLSLAAGFASEAYDRDAASGLVLRAICADGRLVWLENVARSFRTPRGERRWVMNSRDVSVRILGERVRERARQRLEEEVSERTTALHESEARFRALADHAPELISEFDESGCYTFANEAFRELLGRDPGRLAGTHPEALIHPDDLPASRSGMIRAMRKEGPAHAVHRLRHADGSWRWFDNTGRAYRTPLGELRFVSIGRDVTEARRAEAEQRRLQEHMQEVQRLESLGVLAGGIAHDFNNLLAVILGNEALLEAEIPAEAEGRGRLRRIRAAARHAEGLTDQMLAYAGKSVSELEPLDLSELVRGTEDLLRASVGKKCSLELELDPEPTRVEGDATQLRQILLNLVTNASEALGEGGGRIRIRTGSGPPGPEDLTEGFGAPASHEGTWRVLEVTDDGPGMDGAVGRRIFEPFYSTKGSGRGLGLAAVLGIAGAHGGRVRLESRPGEGACFRLLLPACSDEERVPEPRLRRGDAGPAAGAVLVVDDDEGVREVAEALLRRAGFRVETAAGGRRALELLEEGLVVEVVLLDLAMPDLSGGEVLRALRESRPDLPVIIASGYKRDLAAERLGEEEGFGFVKKPYDPDELAAAIRAAIRGEPAG